MDTQSCVEEKESVTIKTCITLHQKKIVSNFMHFFGRKEKAYFSNCQLQIFGMQLFLSPAFHAFALLENSPQILLAFYILVRMRSRQF